MNLVKLILIIWTLIPSVAQSAEQCGFLARLWNSFFQQSRQVEFVKAVRANDIAAVQKLIGAIDINEPIDSFGNTARDLMERRNNAPLLKVIVEAGGIRSPGRQKQVFTQARPILQNARAIEIDVVMEDFADAIGIADKTMLVSDRSFTIVTTSVGSIATDVSFKSAKDGIELLGYLARQSIQGSGASSFATSPEKWVEAGVILAQPTAVIRAIALDIGAGTSLTIEAPTPNGYHFHFQSSTPLVQSPLGDRIKFKPE